MNSTIMDAVVNWAIDFRYVGQLITSGTSTSITETTAVFDALNLHPRGLTDVRAIVCVTLLRVCM